MEMVIFSDLMEVLSSCRSINLVIGKCKFKLLLRSKTDFMGDLSFNVIWGFFRKCLGTS